MSPAEAQSIDPRGELRQDPDGSWNLRCPQCGHWGEIDDDQLHGRVSCDHTNCGRMRAGSICDCTFHETRDWLNTAIRVPGAFSALEPFCWLVRLFGKALYSSMWRQV